jgi:sugar lactone lactonase YvrE
VDRLGPRIYETSELTSCAFQPETEAPIDVATFSGSAMIAVMANRKLKVKGNRCVSDEPLQTKRLSALGTAPDGQLWAASSDDAVSLIGPLDGKGGLDPVWTVNAQIAAIAWAPDGQFLYAADPARGTIYVLQCGGRTPRILTRIPRVSGEPRGLTVDANGRLWIVLYDGWSIARLSVEGEFDRVIALPVPRPTGIAFGGSDGQSIYITSARVGLTRDVIDNAPLSGRLLVIHPKFTASDQSKEGPQRRRRSKTA